MTSAAPSRRRWFRYSLRGMFASVTLAAVALVGLPWSATASVFQWGSWVLAPIFVGSVACGFAASGILFGRGPQAAKIGGAIALGLWLWNSWEMHIQWLPDDEMLRYWPDTVPWRFAYLFARALLVFVLVTVFCLGANRLWHSLAKCFKQRKQQDNSANTVIRA